MHIYCIYKHKFNQNWLVYLACIILNFGQINCLICNLNSKFSNKNLVNSMNKSYKFCDKVV